MHEGFGAIFPGMSCKKKKKILEKMVKGGSFSASCSFAFRGALHLAVAKQRPELLQRFMLSACLAQYAVKVMVLHLFSQIILTVVNNSYPACLNII